MALSTKAFACLTVNDTPASRRHNCLCPEQTGVPIPDPRRANGHYLVRTARFSWSRQDKPGHFQRVKPSGTQLLKSCM